MFLALRKMQFSNLYNFILQCFDYKSFIYHLNLELILLQITVISLSLPSKYFAVEIWKEGTCFSLNIHCYCLSSLISLLIYTKNYKVSLHNNSFDKQNVCLQTYRDNRICWKIDFFLRKMQTSPVDNLKTLWISRSALV